MDEHVRSSKWTIYCKKSKIKKFVFEEEKSFFLLFAHTSIL